MAKKQSKSKVKTTPAQSEFVKQLGQGWLMFVKRPDPKVTLWQGPLYLPDGTDAQIRAHGILNDAKSRYDVEIIATGTWKQLSTFVMKPFGDRMSQDIDIPNIGPTKVWKAKTRNDRNCVRFQILSAPKPDEAVM